MSKTWAWILIIALTVSGFPTAAWADDPAPAPRRTLDNTIYKLEHDEELTIGYIGGSITLGSGASNPAYSWRAKTTKWFEDEYPAAAITEINASIGGFGSIPNVFRVKNHLLSGDPDLVFIDAAVNDYGQNEATIKDSMEGLVRQIYEANPYTDIVMVYTLNKSGAEQDYDNGQLMETVQWHEEIAEYYGIPFINVGYGLYEIIDAGVNGATWETMFRDNEHPSDEGYAIYANLVREFLLQELEQAVPSSLQAYTLPAKLRVSALDKADIVDGYELAVNGFAQEESSMGGRHPHMIVSKEENATAVVNFRGSSVGLYWLKSIDAGYVEWQIDGGQPQLVSGSDAAAISGSARGTYTMLAQNLADGEHTLVLRVVGEHMTGATDTWVRIGGIFVAERSTIPPEPVVIEEPDEEEELVLLFQEEFDAAPTGWTINSAWTRIQRADGEQGDMSMYLPANSANKGMLHSLGEYEGIMTFESDIRYEGAAKQIKIPDILINGSQQGVLASIINGRVSVPYYNSAGSNVRATTEVAENEWHRIIIELNTEYDTFSMWVNGKLLVRNVKFYNGNNAATISQIRYTATNAEDPGFWVDNVRAYEGTARFPKPVLTISDYMLRSVVLREAEGTAYSTNYRTELSGLPFRQGGTMMVPIQDVAGGFHADASFHAAKGLQRISLHGRDIELRAGELAAYADGVLISLLTAPVDQGGVLYTSLEDAALLLNKEAYQDASTGVAMIAEPGTLPPAAKRSAIAVQATQLFEEEALPEADIYVTASGVTGGDGTLGQPFGSLEEAKAAVRALLQAGNTGNINVILREGDYYLNESFTLTDKDSPSDNYKVTYKSFPEERVVIDGGTRVTGWQPFGNGIYAAPLPSGANPLTLYEDKRRATIARTPDGAYSRAIAAELDQKSSFRFEEGDIPEVAHPEQLYVYAWPGGTSGYINWSTARSRTTSVDYGTRTVQLDRELIYEMGTGSRYYIYNALEFLDTPGEYYVDASAGMLYYMPYGDIGEADIVIPARYDLIAVAGSAAAPARNIVLQGLELRGTDLNFSTVSIADAHNIEVRESELYNSGHIGVHIKENAKNNAVENNLIYQMGFYGVFISGKANTRSNDTYGNSVVGNIVRNVGEMNGNAAGIRIMNASHNYVAYNKVSGSPRNGIHIFGIPDPNIMGKILDDVTVTAGNVEDFKIAKYNTIEYNDVSEVVQDSQDTNAIGMWGAGRRNVIRNNKIHDNDLPQLTVNPGHSFWFPLYLDENSNDQRIEGNLVYRNQLNGGGILSAGFHTNASKDAEVLNNVFLDVNYKNAPINSNDMNTSDRVSNGLIAKRNILSNFNGNAYNFMKWTDNVVASIDYNLLNSGNGQYLIGGKAPVETYAEWKDYDNRNLDANSLIDEPRFVSEADDDYRLLYDSPAYAVHFRDINISDIGLRGDYSFADPADPLDYVYVYAAEDPVRKAWAELDEEATLQLGFTIRTQAGYVADQATVTSVTYQSGNPAVAVVDGNGVVSALAQGKTVITVTVQRGGETVASNFEVVVEDSIESISLMGIKSVYETDESFTPAILSETEFGSIRRYDAVTLSADSPDVLIDGMTVTPLAAGTFVITAVSIEDPGLSDSVAFEVMEEMLDRVEVTLDQEMYQAGSPIGWDYKLIGSKGSELDKADATVTLSNDSEGIVMIAGQTATAAQEGVGYLSVTASVYGKIRTGIAMAAVVPAAAIQPPGYSLYHYSRTGTPETAGYAYLIDDDIRLATSGFDAWGTEDSMTLLARTISDESSITVTASVYELQNPPAIEGTGEVAIHAAAGVMMRAGDSPDSNNVFVRYRLNGDVIMSYRNNTYPATSYQKGSVPGQPVEVKLVKEGSLFTGYYKDALGVWIQIASINCEMGDDILVGAGLQSGSLGNMNSAALGDLTIETES